MVTIAKNFINGAWIKSCGTDMLEIINPATRELLGKTPMGTAQDVDAAVNAAQNAFPAWKSTPAPDRIQYLFLLKAKLEEHFEDLAQMITREHGKTLAESRGSVRRGIQMVETACGIPSLLMGDNFENIARDIDCSTVNRPMGVFSCIAPFNFPAMVPFWFWPFAIACGNTYILKPSERVPLTSIRIFELLQDIKMPPGVINMVQGGREVVNSICAHPEIKGISFVGSTPVAKHIYETGSATGKRVQALGGAKNVMVAMPDSINEGMKKRSIATAVESITGCAGERCLAGSLVLCVSQAVYEAFAQGTVEIAAKIQVGDGLNPETNMGPLISQAAKDRVITLIERAVVQGAKVLLDGRKDLDEHEGYFLKPTVLSEVTIDMEIAQEEVFGPVVLLAKADSLDHAIDWINSIPYANTTTLFTASGANARKFSSQVDPSMIGINIGVPAPMAFFSFGGSKDSFFGDIKAHGKAAIGFFTDTYTTIYRWYNESGIW